MKLSVLVVTNRPEHIFWWTWNILKQTYQPHELIVVTNLSEEFQNDFDISIKKELQFHLTNYQIFHTPTGTSIGTLRQKALDLATGDVITYMDDDDWYNPKLFKSYIDSMNAQKVLLISAPGYHRLVIDDLSVFEFEETRNLIHLPFCAMSAYIAKKCEFPRLNIDEDIQWLQQVSNLVDNNRGRALIPYPVLCTIHSKNTWNHLSISGYELARQLTSIKLHENVPLLGIGKDEWSTTWKMLLKMQKIHRNSGEEPL